MLFKARNDVLSASDKGITMRKDEFEAALQSNDPARLNKILFCFQRESKANAAANPWHEDANRWLQQALLKQHWASINTLVKSRLLSVSELSLVLLNAVKENQPDCYQEILAYAQKNRLLLELTEEETSSTALHYAIEQANWPLLNMLLERNYPERAVAEIDLALTLAATMEHWGIYKPLVKRFPERGSEHVATLLLTKGRIDSLSPLPDEQFKELILLQAEITSPPYQLSAAFNERIMYLFMRQSEHCDALAPYLSDELRGFIIQQHMDLGQYEQAQALLPTRIEDNYFFRACLVRAVEAQCHTFIETLLAKQCIKVEEIRNDGGLNLLQVAIKHHDLKTMALLLKAVPNAFDISTEVAALTKAQQAVVAEPELVLDPMRYFFKDWQRTEDGSYTATTQKDMSKWLTVFQLNHGTCDFGLPGPEGISLLQAAIWAKDKALIYLLLSQGASVNDKSSFGFPPLKAAIRVGLPPEIIARLRVAGAEDCMSLEAIQPVLALASPEARQTYQHALREPSRWIEATALEYALLTFDFAFLDGFITSTAELSMPINDAGDTMFKLAIDHNAKPALLYLLTHAYTTYALRQEAFNYALEKGRFTLAATIQPAAYDHYKSLQIKNRLQKHFKTDDEKTYHSIWCFWDSTAKGEAFIARVNSALRQEQALLPQHKRALLLWLKESKTFKYCFPQRWNSHMLDLLTEVNRLLITEEKNRRRMPSAADVIAQQKSQLQQMFITNRQSLAPAYRVPRQPVPISTVPMTQTGAAVEQPSLPISTPIMTVAPSAPPLEEQWVEQSAWAESQQSPVRPSAPAADTALANSPYLQLAMVTADRTTRQTASPIKTTPSITASTAKQTHPSPASQTTAMKKITPPQTQTRREASPDLHYQTMLSGQPVSLMGDINTNQESTPTSELTSAAKTLQQLHKPTALASCSAHAHLNVQAACSAKDSAAAPPRPITPKQTSISTEQLLAQLPPVPTHPIRMPQSERTTQAQQTSTSPCLRTLELA